MIDFDTKFDALRSDVAVGRLELAVMDAVQTLAVAMKARDDHLGGGWGELETYTNAIYDVITRERYALAEFSYDAEVGEFVRHDSHGFAYDPYSINVQIPPNMNLGEIVDQVAGFAKQWAEKYGVQYTPADATERKNDVVPF